MKICVASARAPAQRANVLRMAKRRPSGSGSHPFVGFRLPQSELTALDHYADQRDVTRSIIIREAIAEYIESRQLAHVDLAEAS